MRKRLESGSGGIRVWKKKPISRLSIWAKNWIEIYWNFYFFCRFLENWLEMISLLCTVLTIAIEDFTFKTTCCSIGIMMSFLNFAFLIEKLNVFGLYVLAFRRTILNSSKFFPVFMLIYMGFVLSFRTRTASHNLYFNDTTPNAMLKGKHTCLLFA